MAVWSRSAMAPSVYHSREKAVMMMTARLLAGVLTYLQFTLPAVNVICGLVQLL